MQDDNLGFEAQLSMRLSSMTSDPEIWARHGTQSPAHMRFPVTFSSGMDAPSRPVSDLGTRIRPPPSAAVGGTAHGPIDSTRILVAPSLQPSQGTSFIPPPAPACMQPPLVNRLCIGVVERVWANLRTVAGGVVEDVQRMPQGIGASPSARDHGDMTDRCSPLFADVVRRGRNPSPTMRHAEEESHPAVADARGREAGRPSGRGSVGGRLPETGSEVDTGDDAMQPEGGEVTKKWRTRPWPLEERIDLATFMKRDNAMMTVASGRLSHVRTSVKNEWVSKKMKAEGWISMRRAEEESHPAVADARGREVERPSGRGNVGGRVPETGSEVDTDVDATQPAGGEVIGKRRTRPCPREERIDLVRFTKDNAMITVASGQLKHVRRSARNEWVSKKMKAVGWIRSVRNECVECVSKKMKAPGWIRSAEDCRKKWCDLMSKMKDILHKCNTSGKPSYWEMSVEDKKREGISTTFKQSLWEEMEWAHRKSSVARNNTMASSNLQGAESSVSDKQTPVGHGSLEGGSHTRSNVAESVGFRKKRDGATGKEGANDHLPVSSMERVVLDSSMVVREGMDMAASTLARASTEGANLVATQVGAVASAIKEGNAVLQLLVCVMADRRRECGVETPRTPVRRAGDTCMGDHNVTQRTSNDLTKKKKKDWKRTREQGGGCTMK
ncbi:hypothetical protein CBR_g39903 [Chara braunii]|uniref:Myb-like domain-containing protein n=1 Tax=Chara braunii TaxID=69332 RepID=A0A388K1H6_CHABU|nr:hypothetical protein CBR_g39903 [Chara braunii]|eukprot:GBG63898.1 hypothetical protein CBR_g39903 [Chara braunii]